MTTVLVAGAAGYLGRYVVQELNRHRYRVRAFVRNPEKLGRPGQGMAPAISAIVDEVFPGDATRPDTLTGLCDGVDVVFSSMGRSRSERNPTWEQIDHLGNRNILEQARRAKVSKFVYVSVFRPEEMKESDVVSAHEAFVNDLKESGMDYAIVRPNAYFSDMAQFLDLARHGHLFWLGDGKNRINPIHGADLAKVCVEAIEGREREINAGGPEMFTFSSLFELAFRAVGKKPHITFLPLWLGEGALGLLRLLNPELAGSAAFFVEVSKMDNGAPAFGSLRLEDYFRTVLSTSNHEA
ncbi:MAG: SDR family oxidoreductase [Chlorobiaceae bacterium]|nr:SDR family oxidoreductase [Chlorobiaceae bacterium]NTW74214.1 SDR family oxidoreductase [Chlorobiaceae bacterium]